MLAVLYGMCYVPESAKFLYSKRNFQDAKEALLKAKQINKGIKILSDEDRNFNFSKEFQ